MRLLAPLLILGAALVALLMTPPESRLFGLDHQAVAGRPRSSPSSSSFSPGRGPSDFARVIGSASLWAALFLALTGVYSYRFEAADFFGRIAAELLPSEPQVGQGGAVIVNRRLSGEFAVAARVNAARVTFLFDTGASMVVLTAADARRAGVNAAGLAYDVPVTTANGSALAADIRLDQVAVGPIVMHNVSALVARPGALEESLLGMSFLERLKSYTVERGRLILTAR